MDSITSFSSGVLGYHNFCPSVTPQYYTILSVTLFFARWSVCTVIPIDWRSPFWGNLCMWDLNYTYETSVGHLNSL